MQTLIGSTPVWIDYMNQFECDEYNESEELNENYGDTEYTPGFYWCVCSPECIPDSEWFGPFDTEELAEENANEFLNW